MRLRDLNSPTESHTLSTLALVQVATELLLGPLLGLLLGLSLGMLLNMLFFMLSSLVQLRLTWYCWSGHRLGGREPPDKKW